MEIQVYNFCDLQRNFRQKRLNQNTKWMVTLSLCWLVKNDHIDVGDNVRQYSNLNFSINAAVIHLVLDPYLMDKRIFSRKIWARQWFSYKSLPIRTIPSYIWSVWYIIWFHCVKVTFYKLANNVFNEPCQFLISIRTVRHFRDKELSFDDMDIEDYADDTLIYPLKWWFLAKVCIKSSYQLSDAFSSKLEFKALMLAITYLSVHVVIWIKTNIYYWVNRIDHELSFDSIVTIHVQYWPLIEYDGLYSFQIYFFLNFGLWSF